LGWLGWHGREKKKNLDHFLLLLLRETSTNHKNL
jgi:hypothetical protein